jgi:uncharacterized membrane protein YuzA (DUF378 family)
MDYLQMLISLLIIVGAINWGLVAYNGTDLVTIGAGVVGQPQLERIVKLTVGVAGLYALYQFGMAHMSRA